MHKKETNNYHQIIKATTIFGGVQIFNILIQIIRSKVIAVLLGPTGMGILGLLNSTINLIARITNFGLGTSAVKDIAEADSTGNHLQVSRIIIILRRLVWITGSLGALVTLFFSSWLSELAFGDRKYTLAFIWLSVTLLINQLSSGQLVLLQGLRKLKHLANANLTGAILGLFISIPMYYIWDINGIVPAMIATSLMSLIRSWYFTRKVKTQPVKVTIKSSIVEGKSMIIMGFMLSLSGLISVGFSYLVRIYISRTGSIDDVGLYNAGFAIINTYVGLIFSAMSTDYYPRLAAIAKNNQRCKQLINQQAEMTSLLLTPIIIIFLVFIQWLVILLYSNKFVTINTMLLWAATSMLFKAASWPVGYLLLASGNNKAFFWSELLANSYMFLFSLFGYHLWGLNGLGISFFLSYLLLMVQVYIIVNRLYNFSYTRIFYKLFIFQFVLVGLAFLTKMTIEGFFSYVIGIVLITISLIHSYKEIDKRIDLKVIFYKVFKKQKENN